MTDQEKEESKPATKGEVTKIVTSADVKWFLATLVSVAVGAVIFVSWVDTRAEEPAKKVQKELDAFKIEMRDTTRRLDQKTDAILFGLRLPNPAPAPNLPDGGM